MNTEKTHAVNKVKNPELDQTPPKNLIRPDTSAKPGSTKPEKHDDESETAAT
jgi:hypothetical protein